MWPHGTCPWAIAVTTKPAVNSSTRYPPPGWGTLANSASPPAIDCQDYTMEATPTAPSRSRSVQPHLPFAANPRLLPIRVVPAGVPATAAVGSPSHNLAPGYSHAGKTKPRTPGWWLWQRGIPSGGREDVGGTSGVVQRTRGGGGAGEVGAGARPRGRGGACAYFTQPSNVTSMSHVCCLQTLAQAVITISPSDNPVLRDWIQDLPQHMAAAAAHNTTGEPTH
jgi:hypothetical protein